MNRKKERFLWFATTSLLVLTLLGFLFAPNVLAQNFRSKNYQEYLQTIEAAFSIIENNYVDEIDPQKLFKGAIEGLFSGLDDPYSLYLDDEFLEKITDTTQGKYGGVGLYISKDTYEEDNPYGRLPYVKVVSPIENTPSWRAGINAGDYIYAIEGETAEGYSTQDVSNKLRGSPGTEVEVTLLRNGSFTFDLTLSREEIEIPTVKTAVIDEDIAYLRIIEFTPFTVPRVEEVLTEFSTQGFDQLIVDVRSNPGGLLDTVIDVADMFFSGGVIVSTQYRRSGQDKKFRANPGKKVPSNTEIVVLIDKGSASASEILTGALKDRHRATIIGETSFGKGSIQQMIPLNASAIKITTGRYYTPSGQNIDKIGIEPDIVVVEPELSEEESKDYATILQENRVGLFVDSYPMPKKRDIDRFMRDLEKEDLDPSEHILRLLIKRESERRLNSPPVVDLEYDRVLNRAREFFRTQKKSTAKQ